MSPKRAEPFLVALQTLRSGLREGAYGFERRLAATEIAEGLALSATPVREALARLAGEGLVEDRRGQGYFVRRPTAGDVADLYRLALAHLTVALDPRRPRLAARDGLPEPDATEAPTDVVVERVDRLFERWVAEAGGWSLEESYARAQARLAPIRRREPLLLDDLAAEAESLAAVADDPAARLAAARRFHRRRIVLAGRLTGVLESRAAARSIGPI
jgi:DNA-binding GntR family transcriptional regulator